MVVIASGILIAVSCLHPEKADFPMEETVSGISIEVIHSQFQNASSQIVVIASGKSSLVGFSYPPGT